MFRVWLNCEELPHPHPRFESNVTEDVAQFATWDGFVDSLRHSSLFGGTLVEAGAARLSEDMGTNYSDTITNNLVQASSKYF